MSAVLRAEQQNAAVFNLPDELLLDVFARGLYAQWVLSKRAWELRAVQYLRAITAVCSQWRISAIADPLLWRRISVTSSIPFSTKIHSSTTHRVDTFLRRSESITLDIHIDPYVCTVNPVKLLLRHLHRSRKLSLVCPYRVPDHHPGSTMELPGPLANLIDLRISGTLVEVPSNFPSLDLRLAMLGPNNGALLERLDLDLDGIDDDVDLSDGFANLRTERLRRLSLTCSREDWFEDIMRLVSRCAHVEDLSLTLECPDEPMLAPFTLSSVMRFTLSFPLPYWLLHTISMPALETLCIDAVFMPPTGYISPATGGIFPCLRSVHFNHYPFSDIDICPLSRFLRANPSIETILATNCKRHRVIIFAMFDPFEKHALQRPSSELPEANAISGLRQDIETWMLPNLKYLRLRVGGQARRTSNEDAYPQADGRTIGTAEQAEQAEMAEQRTSGASHVEGQPAGRRTSLR